MKALFVHDTYYAQNEGGGTHSFGAFPYSLWEERFLPHFDEMTIIGRRKSYDANECAHHPRSDGKHVSFQLLDNINHPLKRIFQAKPVIAQIENAVRAHDLVIIRGPVEFGMIAAHAARKNNKPYIVEMSGCAYDHTKYHGSLVGKLYAPVKMKRAQKMLKYADAAIYVTQKFLQQGYPTNGHAAAASNVEINTPNIQTLENRLARIESYKLPLQIGLIGNYDNGLKGLGTAIAALGSIKKNIPPFQLRILGKGNPALWTEDIQTSGLQQNVIFDGVRDGGTPVLEWLDGIDLYIQPSFHEGLPRALIEALSRGLPALASDAGGTDELLPPENIHRRGNVSALAARLECTITDKVWMKEQAHLNFDTAKMYTRDVLLPIRYQFWADVKKMVRARDKF